MKEPLLWSLDETAHRLGGVCTRTVIRLINKGAFLTCKVGRRRMVIAASVRLWVDEQEKSADNQKHVGRGVRGEIACHKKHVGSGTESIVDPVDPTYRIIGPATSMRVVKELAEK